MLSDKEVSLLKTYFGFANKKKAILVGEKMDEYLSKNKSCYFLILPDCNLKRRVYLEEMVKDKMNVITMIYSGNINLNEYVQYERLNAIVITDINLGKAIFSILEEEIGGV